MCQELIDAAKQAVFDMKFVIDGVAAHPMQGTVNKLERAIIKAQNKSGDDPILQVLGATGE